MDALSIVIADGLKPCGLIGAMMGQRQMIFPVRRFSFDSLKFIGNSVAGQSHGNYS